MPNTLAHLGIQGLATRSLLRGSDLRWIAVGCVIPDLPWILQRLVRAIAPDTVSPYDLRMYAVAQSSLIGCLCLAAALSLLAADPRRTARILGLNVALHLLLDGLQTKWANGVHLFAPVSWKLFNLGLFWPESVTTVALTLLGLGFMVRGLSWPAPARAWDLRAGRLAIAAGLAVAWLVAPLPLLSGPERAGNHFVDALRHGQSRAGRPVEFDRNRHLVEGETHLLQTFADERLRLTGNVPELPGTVSLRGRFLDPATVEVEDWHRHWPRFRDLASYLGLGLAAAAWLTGGRRKRREDPGGVA